MNASLENFARKHAHMSLEEAYEALVAREDVQEWLHAAPERESRLRDEFERVWKPENGTHAPAAPTPRVHPQPRSGSSTKAAATRKPTRADDGSRYLCTTCGASAVQMNVDATVTCGHCDKIYTNLLELIPVKAVGPLALLFGEGWRSIAVPVVYTSSLTALYMVLRWLR